MIFSMLLPYSSAVSSVFVFLMVVFVTVIICSFLFSFTVMTSESEAPAPLPDPCLYPHSSHTPSFHSCASFAIISLSQQSHFLIWVVDVFIHFASPLWLSGFLSPYFSWQYSHWANSVQVASPPLCAQTYPHSVHTPFSH